MKVFVIGDYRTGTGPANVTREYLLRLPKGTKRLMKLSINWLKEFIDLSDLSIDDIVGKIYKAGFEVENIDYIGNATNLVAGEVIECSDHPDSDHLHVTKVYTGSEVLDIVC